MTRQIISLSVDPDKLKEIDAFCKKEGINRSAILIKSFNVYKNLKNERVYNITSSEFNPEQIFQELKNLRELIQFKKSSESELKRELQKKLEKLPSPVIPNQEILKKIEGLLEKLGPLDTQKLSILTGAEESLIIVMMNKIKNVILNENYDWELLN